MTLEFIKIIYFELFWSVQYFPNIYCLAKLKIVRGFPGSSAGEESTCNAEDPAWIPELESSLGEEIGYPLQYSWASLVAQTVKNLLAMWKTWIEHPWVGRIPWKRAWQPTPVFLPGESPWTEEPGRIQFHGGHIVGHNWATKHITKNDKILKRNFSVTL